MFKMGVFLTNVFAIILILSTLQSGVCPEDITTASYKRIKTCNDTTSHYASVTTTSNLMCASVCSRDQSCLYFDWCTFPNNKTCRLHGNIDQCSEFQDNSQFCVIYKKNMIAVEGTTFSGAASTETVTEFTFLQTTTLQETDSTTAATTSDPNPCQNDGVYNSISDSCICHAGCYGTYCGTCYLDCEAGTLAGLSGIIVGYIHPPGTSTPVKTLCNYDVGVTYVQTRLTGNVNFNRSWAEYRDGFGDPAGDFWLGNKYIYVLYQYKYYGTTFRVWHDFQWNYYNYYYIQLDTEENKYTLSYDPTVYPTINGLTPSDNRKVAQGQTFKTYDSDITGCAAATGSAWWFNTGCSVSNINGPFPVTWGTVTTVTKTAIGLL